MLLFRILSRFTELRRFYIDYHYRLADLPITGKFAIFNKKIYDLKFGSMEFILYAYTWFNHIAYWPLGALRS